MSHLGQIQRRLGMLHDIGGIMSAMRNLALMETHKLARFLTFQHRVLMGIEACAADFLDHYPEFGYRPELAPPGVIIAIGSQRGFCRDFNESLAQALRRHEQLAGGQPASLLVVGQRLATKLGRTPRMARIIDGPGVSEEVPTVLPRLMDALGELQAQQGHSGLLSVSVFAHRDGESELTLRMLLPAPMPGQGGPRFAYPPELNVTASAFFAELARHYLWAQLHDVFYSSLMAENRRRLQHMEGAVQRMEDKADELRRQYNLLRQEEITEEIEVILLSNEALRHASGGH